MMRIKNTKQVAGFATCLTVIATVCVAIPAIGGKTVDQRSNTTWAAAAADFRAFDADATTFSAIATPRLNDAADIRALSDLRVEHRRWAENRAAEHKCLSEAIYYEARSESRSGQLAVADVVKNRVKSKHYPNSICGVVYQNADRAFACQFSFACDGSMNRSPKGYAWEHSQNMAQLSLTGHVGDLTKNSTHYHTVQINPNWADTLEFKAKIGFHLFYRPSWSEREPASVSIAVAPPA